MRLHAGQQKNGTLYIGVTSDLVKRIYQLLRPTVFKMIDPVLFRVKQCSLAMEHIFDNGGVKQLGISNCYDLQQLKLLYRNAKVKPAVIQNRFYDETQYDHNIRDFCQQQRIIYQSFWTLTANPKILAHSTLQTLAGKYHRSAAQVFFRYLNQINIIPLTGTTSETHMREDLAIIDFELTAEECHAVGKLL